MLLPLGSAVEEGTFVTNRLKILEMFQHVVNQRGYRGISTPVVEYASTFTNASVGMKLQDMMKWFNGQGEIEVLRPDWTTAIARALAKSQSKYKKWAYQGPVYDRQKQGLEKMQAGIEIIDTPILLGETECLLMAVSFLRKLYTGPVLIELAHTGIFEDFINNLNLDNVEQEKLRQAMHAKRKDEVYSLVLSHSNQEVAKEFAGLIDAYGSEEILDVYQDNWKDYSRRLNIIARLQKMVSILKACGVTDIIIDLGQVKQLPYYSGSIFRGFLKESGETCFSGGRYDPLYEHFGKRRSAVGLAFDVDVLANQIQPDPETVVICVVTTENTLAFAEQLREKYPNSILDIQFHVNEDYKYDRILYLKEDEGEIKVVEG